MLVRSSILLMTGSREKNLLEMMGDAETEFQKYIEIYRNLEKFNWRLAYKVLYRYMLKCLHKGHVDNMKDKI